MMKMPPKDKVLELVISELERQLQTMEAAALEARDAATNEESKAENKYDTRGLEASYLAGAQSERAEELKANLRQIKSLNPRDYNKDIPINFGALVCLSADESDPEYFYILPSEGGVEIRCEGTKLITLSPHSALGKQIYNQYEGHDFELKRRSKLSEFEIIKVN